MKIKYWTSFSKRKNSTKQPTGGTEVDVVLKDGSSIVNPVIDSASIPINANYFYIDDFGRYYFLSDANKITKDRTIFTLKSDPMASAKTAIGSTSAMIDRASADFNQWLPDAELFPTNEIVQNAFVASNLTNINSDYDKYVIRAVGKNGARNYVVDSQFIQDAFSSWYDITSLHFSTIEENLESLFNAVAQPAQYIQSIKWFPFSPYEGSSETVYFGFRPSASQAPRSGDRTYSYCTVNKPAAYYNDERDYDPRFTTFMLFLPGYGTITIDPKYLESNLVIEYDGDVDSGNGNILVKADSVVIFTAALQLAVDVPFGGIAGGGSTLPAGISQILGSLSITPMKTLSNAMSGLEKSLSGVLSPPQSTTGSSGNRGLWYSITQVFAQVTRLGSSGKSNTTIGQPLREHRQISTLSGFIVCSKASVQCALSDGEKDEINDFLNGGFYYE